MVGAEVLHFALKGGIILLSSSPVDCICVILFFSKEPLNTWPIRASSYRWVCTGMKRPRVNRAPMSLGRQELWKGAVEVVGDKRGNGILLTIRDDKEVASSSGIPVIAPSRSWKHAGLGAFWHRGGVLLVYSHVHSCDIELTATLIENKSHVLNQTFILNSGLNWVVCCLNKSL